MDLFKLVQAWLDDYLDGDDITLKVIAKTFTLVTLFYYIALGLYYVLF